MGGVARRLFPGPRPVEGAPHQDRKLLPAQGLCGCRSLLPHLTQRRPSLARMADLGSLPRPGSPTSLLGSPSQPPASSFVGVVTSH